MQCGCHRRDKALDSPAVTARTHLGRTAARGWRPSGSRPARPRAWSAGSRTLGQGRGWRGQGGPVLHTDCHAAIIHDRLHPSLQQQMFWSAASHPPNPLTLWVVVEVVYEAGTRGHAGAAVHAVVRVALQGADDLNHSQLRGIQQARLRQQTTCRHNQHADGSGHSKAC